MGKARQMLARSSRVFGVAGLALAAFGCSDDDGADPAAHGNGDLSDVVYAGLVTDEALEQLLDRTPKDIPAQRLVIDSPQNGETLSKDAPAALAFHSAVTGRLEQRPRPQHYTAPDFRARFVSDLVGLFGPIRAAHAHGTPYNGVAYFLEISDARGSDALRIFTDQTSHQPAGVEWAALADLPQPLTLTITSALFEENKIPSDGGPFLGGTAEFRVE